MTKHLDPLVHALARLNTQKWRKLSHTMTWYFRDTPNRPLLPKILDRYMQEEPLTEADWIKVRERANLERRRERVASARKVEREKQQNRRRYMRQYMRNYRATS